MYGSMILYSLSSKEFSNKQTPSQVFVLMTVTTNEVSNTKKKISKVKYGTVYHPKPNLIHGSMHIILSNMNKKLQFSNVTRQCTNRFEKMYILPSAAVHLRMQEL